MDARPKKRRPAAEEGWAGDMAFRQAMRRLAGSVALVTAADASRRYGMTMTAVMSLSMEPPSLAASVNRSASIFPAVEAGRPFCVNLLGHAQQEVCRRFSALPSSERFTVGEWLQEEGGAPFLKGAQANVFCEVGPIHGFGSHALVVGLVKRVLVEESVSPLVYLDARYGGVSFEPAAEAEQPICA